MFFLLQFANSVFVWGGTLGNIMGFIIKLSGVSGVLANSLNIITRYLVNNNYSFWELDVLYTFYHIYP